MSFLDEEFIDDNYIGQTLDPFKRKKQHTGTAKKLVFGKQTKLQDVLRKIYEKHRQEDQITHKNFDEKINKYLTFTIIDEIETNNKKDVDKLELSHIQLRNASLNMKPKYV